MREVVGIDARAVVGDDEGDAITVVEHRELDAVAAVADGVVEQVDEHAQERGPVAVEDHRRRRRDEDDARVDGLGGVAPQLDGVERLACQVGSGVLQAAVGEEVVDEAVEQRRLVLRALEMVGLADALLDRFERPPG